MSHTLLIYSTTDGHTLKISQHMQKAMEDKGDKASILPVEDVSTETLAQYNKIVIGASIRYGKHQKVVLDFIQQNKTILESKISAFYTVNLVARKAEKCHPDTNPYIKKMLTKLDWKPTLKGVFAGKLNYQKYDFLDRNMIRFIMWMTKGPTDPKSNIEFTNWESVTLFAETISEMEHN